MRVSAVLPDGIPDSDKHFFPGKSTDRFMTNKRILFVDDEPAVLDSLRRILRRERNVWDMTFIDDPTAALEQALTSGFDAIVTDMNMPQMTGLQLLSRLRGDRRTEDVPVVMLTGQADRSLKREALDLGATDLLAKPVETEELLARLRNVLRLKACQDELRNQNERLEVRVRRRTKQLEASRLDIIWRLGKAAEFRDEDTGNHILRVGYYSRTIATAMGLERDFIERLFLAAPLHDIGKIGVPDSILLKPGRLTKDEWRVMRQHCTIGASILQQQSNMGRAFAGNDFQELEVVDDAVDNPILELAATVALTHHEKWNGDGYPNGLAAEAIPLAGRIVAVSDAFDALTSERTYKPAYSYDKSRSIIKEDAGTHFDPDVFAAFDASFDDMVAIRQELSDELSASTPLRTAYLSNNSSTDEQPTSSDLGVSVTAS